MHRHNRIKRGDSVNKFTGLLFWNKKGDIPGWVQIIGLIIGLFALIFLIWLSIKSGQTGVEVLTEIR